MLCHSMFVVVRPDEMFSQVPHAAVDGVRLKGRDATERVWSKETAKRASSNCRGRLVSVKEFAGALITQDTPLVSYLYLTYTD